MAYQKAAGLTVVDLLRGGVAHEALGCDEAVEAGDVAVTVKSRATRKLDQPRGGQIAAGDL